MTQTKKNYKEVKITRVSETIYASADKVWEIVGPGFANAGEWSTAVDFSIGSGEAQFEGATCSTRACDLNANGFSKISEKLVHYDVKNKELAYEVTNGMPGFVLKAQNHWKVIDKGNGLSALQMTMTMHNTKLMGVLMGGMMKSNLNKLIPTIFRDLKVYAETGQISAEKRKRMAKLKVIR